MNNLIHGDFFTFVDSKTLRVFKNILHLFEPKNTISYVSDKISQ